MLAATLLATTVMAKLDLDQICRDAFVAAKSKLPAEKLIIDDVSITVMELEGKTWRVGGRPGPTRTFARPKT